MRPRKITPHLLAAVLFMALGGYLLEGTLLGRAALAYVRTADLTPVEQDNRVLFQAGAEKLSARIAMVLPEAIRRVEDAERLHFVRPPKIQVFADWDTFEKYTGSRPGPAAVAIMDRIAFSPKLADQPHRVSAIVAHELSHLLLHQQMGMAYLSLPAWFDEGLAVLVSGGGGAETVSEADALTSILRGERFTPNVAESIFRRSHGATFGLSEHMFYRQAAMFVRYLRNHDEQKFQRLLSGLATGEDFATAFAGGYGSPVEEFWRTFIGAGPQT